MGEQFIGMKSVILLTIFYLFGNIINKEGIIKKYLIINTFVK